MPSSARDNTTYTGNRAEGDSTNIYGNVYGGLHLPGRSSGPGDADTVDMGSAGTRDEHDARLLRQVALDDADEEDGLRHCVPYVHFGM
jgi:hypothetical protein